MTLDFVPSDMVRLVHMSTPPTFLERNKNMMVLKGLKAAEKFVRKQADAGNDVRWEGFDKIIFFRPDDRAMRSPQGALRDGVWGYDNVVTVDGNGVWNVDYRNVRRISRTRN
jgi:hypothetical protein